jgi:hypothetical protein
MEDRTLIIALPLPSHQRPTISGRYPTILTKYIFPCGAVRWHRWPEVAMGREGETPSCTPRGARWAEFNLEQPYVLWCSVHGQCSRHRTNARQQSPDGNHAGFVRTFSLLSQAHSDRWVSSRSRPIGRWQGSMKIWRTRLPVYFRDY